MAADSPTLPDAFRRIVELLEAEGVPFVVIGGIAVGLQGEPRFTIDVDLMVTLAAAQVPGFASTAKSRGFDIEPELAETQWRASGFVRLWLGPDGDRIAIDLIACKSDYLREVAWRAEQTQFCGVRAPVATPEDLILLKTSAWREKDIPDIRSIILRHDERLDRAYLRRWATWFKGSARPLRRHAQQARGHSQGRSSSACQPTLKNHSIP